MKTTTAEARWDENRRYWKINVQQDGVRKSFYEKVEGRRGKRMCEAKAQEWLDDNCPTDMTFAVAWEKYLASKEGHISAETMKSYSYTGKNKLIPLLGKKKLSAITVQDWQRCIDRSAAGGSTNKSLQSLRALIANFVRFCRRSRFPAELSVDLEIPKSAPRINRTTLQPEHIQVLFSSDATTNRGSKTPDFFIHAYRFCVVTGLRRGELVGLRWEDIDGNIINVRRSITPGGRETPGKNKNAQRSFILPDRAVEELNQQKDMLTKAGIISPWVFPNKHGGREHPVNLLERWHIYCDTNDLPHFVLHELRHTAVSMYETALPEKLLKQTIGHSASFDTSGVYGHRFGDEDNEAARVMNGVLEHLLV